MAGTHIHRFQIVAAAILLAVSAASHAVVFKWVEEDGKVIYSNELPPDRSKVTELTRIDDLELIPADRRGSLGLDREKRNSSSVVATPAPAAPVPGDAPAVVRREPVTLLSREPFVLVPREPVASAREEAPAPPRVYPRSRHTTAVQDPCLMSSDPRCYERNKGNYHPVLGYSPATGAVAQAAGATSSSAGGAVGAQVPASQAAVAPQPQKRSAQASSPGVATIEWTRPVR